MDGAITLAAVYARETYDEAVRDIAPLLREHHLELALYQEDVPLDPDFSFYEAADKAGLTRIYTARIGGRMVGYAIYVVRLHPHYRTHRWAICDIVFVHPDHRNLGVGNGLYDFIETDLRKGGPIVLHTTSKSGHPELGALLAMRGHALVELGYSKRLA